ncbi:MAG: SIR2 family protein [Candidatus Tectomicrobia bacterium]|nr:SIR2 family protein [Candidatus Tectomicrobia bacterium]
MTFPDQSHINRVRDALWRRIGGGASVMIGSGFSKNATKVRPDAGDPPLWSDVVEEMCRKLYPHKASAMTGTGGHLRIAQEYETAFGRSDLHHFIRHTVRDDDFEPADIHKRLLKMPWRDVFTTNWDTLLEKTRISVPERAYGIVRTVDEIPMTSRPRIIKLHGSLPAQFPLICTEEDYRTYPTTFAPLVNTVQQAMMETTFCLIGFSGDDPNFLQWSGWVRDNLGHAAPKIYLAGYLDLSPHRRRMLEDRDVVPIDLAHHPKSSTWPELLHHHYATEWLLHTLELGLPYDLTRWPAPSDKRHLTIPQQIQPVEEPVFTEPLPRTTPPSPKDNEEKLAVTGRETLKTWNHNRNMYPGWLAVPADSRRRNFMNQDTEEWEKALLRVLPEFPPVERLNAIHEIVWRREIMLEPITRDLEKIATETLVEINCQHQTIKGITDPDADWTSVRHMWSSIMLALVGVARYRFEQETFEERIVNLSPFLQDHPDIPQRIHHERCLWTAYHLDFRNLEGLLKNWHTERCDPVWMLRKAALLLEVNRVEESIQILNRMLLHVRENPGDERSLTGPSREGWALHLVAMFEGRYRLRESEENQFESPQSFRERDERWVELTALKCDAFGELKRYEEDIIEKPQGAQRLPFDLGVQRGETYGFSNARYNRRIAAHRAIRLYEIAGLAVADSHVLELAAQTLAVSHPELATRLVLRISHYDQDATLTHVFSRTRVAAMPADLAEKLARACQDIIEYEIPRMATEPFWPIAPEERLRVALEVLSRLILRLESETVQEIFSRSLAHYQTEALARHSWMADPISNLLSRCWEALTKEHRTTLVFELLGAPIVGLNIDIQPDLQYRYPDPGDLLDDDCLAPAFATIAESRRQEILSLLVRGLQAGGEPRKRASRRVASKAFREQLKEVQAPQIAQALWSETYTHCDGLPGETSLHDWVFMLLPEPETGIAEQRFRQKWLTPSHAEQNDSPDPADILWQVGDAIRGLRAHQQPLMLSDNDNSYLTNVIARWLGTEIPHPAIRHVIPFFSQQYRRNIMQAVFGLQSILAEIDLPESIGDKLYKRVQTLNDAEMPGSLLVIGLVKTLPHDRVEELTLLIQKGLASENEEVAGAATAGLHHWAMASSKVSSQIQPPPNVLIHEIGIIIANRRKTSLDAALQMAKWVFSNGSNAQKDAIQDLALHGLGILAEELRYDREDQNPYDDIPWWRWQCMQLAQSMAENGFVNTPVVSRWLEIAENDPLPEGRHMRRTDQELSPHPAEDMNRKPNT